jgi:molybdopterin/thiamine biosynthesis adenylyltransferase
VVERTNLANNPFLQERHVGIPKSKAAAEVARSWSLRKVKARSYQFDVTYNDEWGHLNDFVAGVDLVYGCFDNLPARFSLNSATIVQGVKFVDLGVEGFSGRVRLIDRSRACYACNPLVPEHLSTNIFSLTQNDGEGCDYAPTVTILPTAMLTAAHAIIEGLKFLGILRNGGQCDYLYYDFLTSDRPVRMQITKRKDCTICGPDGLVKWRKLGVLGAR